MLIIPLGKNKRKKKKSISLEKIVGRTSVYFPGKI